LAGDARLRAGLNVHAGKVTCRAVAEALGMAYTPAADAFR
jgi:alanine dehydrogenase